MNITKLLAVALLSMVALTANAQKKQSLHDQFTGQGYGMAGCGLGSVVFGEQKGMIQVIAATLNGTAGNQTFGMTSGTSNCGEMKHAMKTNDFIETNKVVLEKDIVRGQGETLGALSQLMNCKNSNFSQEIKKNYSSSFPQGGASTEALQAVAYQSCTI